MNGSDMTTEAGRSCDNGNIVNVVHSDTYMYAYYKECTLFELAK